MFFPTPFGSETFITAPVTEERSEPGGGADVIPTKDAHAAQDSQAGDGLTARPLRHGAWLLSARVPMAAPRWRASGGR